MTAAVYNQDVQGADLGRHRMKYKDGTSIYSAADLSRFLVCRRLTVLDKLSASIESQRASLV